MRGPSGAIRGTWPPVQGHAGVRTGYRRDSREDTRMVNRQPRSRLEQLTQASHMSIIGFQKEFANQASRCGEGKAVHISERQVKRWLAGGAPTPLPTSCRVLEHWWGESVERLLGPPEPEVIRTV